MGEKSKVHTSVSFQPSQRDHEEMGNNLDDLHSDVPRHN